jgi:hypothetical protein
MDGGYSNENDLSSKNEDTFSDKSELLLRLLKETGEGGRDDEGREKGIHRERQ